MTDTFRAIVADKTNGGVVASIRDLQISDLPDEDVLVDVSYSTLNYKDGLALTGAAPICRTLPLICGIDLAGTVVESRDPAFGAGDRVLVNGFGLSESFAGGYSQKQRLKGEWLVRVPESLSLEESMAIGTAGYTAMLCVHALQDAGIAPGTGPVLVTGAAGGVGSIAVSLLAGLGYEVHASTGRIDAAGGFLRDLGAAALVPREDLARDCKPLERELWAGVVDTVGDKTLATAIAQSRYDGVVAACGLAGGMALPTTVMPFILRSVTLRGIDSVMAPLPRRQRAWDALAELLDREQLEKIYNKVPLADVLKLAPQILSGQVRGRVVVDVNA